MPFIDLDTKHPDSFLIPSAEVVIVGAGAAGILLSVKLTAQGKSVLLLESGNFFEDQKKQKLNEVQQTGKILNNAIWGRKRIIGGTTTAWGGQSLPFTPMDFENREWVQNSGWPVSYDEMISFYDEANLFMGIDTMNYSTDIFPKISIKKPDIDPDVFDFHVSKWAHQPNFYLLYKTTLDKKVTVIYNAQVNSILKTDSDTVSGVVLSNFKNCRFNISAKTLIIAAGTIETNRILLNNNLGNHSGWLGKSFMDHPCIEIGLVRNKNTYTLQRVFNTHIWKGNKYSIRLSLAKKFQMQNKVLNCSASIMFQFSSESFDPYGELKAFKKDFNLRHLLKISGSIFSIFKSSWAYLFKRFYYKAGAIAKLSLMTEQEPSIQSYISLSDKRDEFGIPEALINWHITPKTWNTIIEVSAALKTQIEHLGLGEVELYNHIKENFPCWSDELSDVCHHMGGSKMSITPRDGVVNKNLQVWGASNLYVCSCAVFPTSSHSNPTLTMLALACRLADHLN